jgi:CubicO group peptidase (beta-lactamase class C family)
MQRQWPIAAALSACLLSASAPAQQAGQIDPRIAPLFSREQGDTRAALLLEDGRVVAKHYAPGYSDANRLISWSMAKTVTAMLVGELVSDGKLQLDAPAPIAEWHKPGDPRAKITLRNLLNMASGLEHVEVGKPIEKSDTNQVLFVGGTQDMAARAIAKPIDHPPGAEFKYSSLTTIILAEIITRTLTDSRDPHVRAKAYRDFEYARIFTPAGVTSAFPEFDGAGTQIGGSLIHMTLDDWGRMGKLLTDGKGADGSQVIAPDWLAFMKTPSARNPHYGGQTWLNSFAHDKPGAPATAAMDGHLGQYVVTFAGVGRDGQPHHYVLVRLGNTREDQLDRVQAAVDAITRKLVPVVGG